MLNNDRRRMELAFSLLFSLPGTPVVRYGQEIGMGEDLSLEGRSSVRTVMQWSNGKNGGFSDAPTEKLIRPVIAEGEFGYKKVNVNDQHRDPDSFLNWVSRIIDRRKEFPEFGWGNYKVLETGNSKVLAHMRQSDQGLAIAVHNFSGEEITIKLNLENPEEIMDVFSNEKSDAFDPDSQKIKLTPYGYRWLHKRKKFL